MVPDVTPPPIGEWALVPGSEWLVILIADLPQLTQRAFLAWSVLLPMGSTDKQDLVTDILTLSGLAIREGLSSQFQLDLPVSCSWDVCCLQPQGIAI